MKKVIAVLSICILLVGMLAGCTGKNVTQSGDKKEGQTSAEQTNAADYLKGKNIRVVIGSTSVSGDTYLTADLVSRYISDTYGCNMKVDAIGAGRALEEIVSTKPDGNTIMMFHDMTYLGVLFGAYKEADYKLENMVVGGSFGYSPGDCFAASASAKYTNIKEMAEWMKANSNEIVKIAVEAGGVSQLAFNSVYEWVKTEYGEDVASRLKVFVTGSTDEKLQALWDGNCQVIFGTVSSFKEYTLDGVDAKLKLNIVGLLSDEKPEGESFPTLAEQGVVLNGEKFSFAKEYFAFYPKGIDQQFIDAMNEAMKAVCTSQEYIKAIEELGYKAQYLNSEDAKKHIYEKRDYFKPVIENGPNFDDLVG